MKYQIVIDADAILSFDFIPTLCIGFYKNDHEASVAKKCDKILKQFSDLDIVMCSSESNIYNTLPYINHSHDCIFVFFAMKQESYHIEMIQQKSDITTLAKRIDLHQYSTILFSTLEQDISELMMLLKKVMHPNQIFGALAGAPLGHYSSDTAKIYYKGTFYDDITIMLLFDNTQYEVKGIGLHMFEPIGFELEITQWEEREVYEIEKRPALDMIENIIGEITPEGLEFNEYPVFISNKYNPNNTKILTSLQKIDRNNKSLTFYKKTLPKSTLKPAIGISQDDQEKQFYTLAKAVKDADFVFMFICVLVKGYWKNIEPIYLMHLSRLMQKDFIGFHGFGEISPYEVNGESFYQNQSVTLVSIAEKANHD